MNAAKVRSHRVHTLRHLQRSFLCILPQIVRHGHVCFRHLKCADRHEDAIAEMTALCWKWFVRLAQRGKDGTRFPVILAHYAGRAVRSGRRLCGQEKAKDVSSLRAQQRHGFAISQLPQASSSTGNVFDEALHDNTQTPVPDQVGFRMDFPRWRKSRCKRDRRLIDDLMLGERTLDAARRHGLTAGRISQLRRDFRDDWLAFCDELPGHGSAPAAAHDGHAAPC